LATGIILTSIKILVFFRKKRRIWVRPIFSQKEREEKGQIALVQHMLLVDDEEKFFNYTRFTRHEYFQIFDKVKNKLTKNHTNFRKPISPEIKLALIFRYIATGMSMTSLQYDFRVGLSTVSGIIKDALNAIYEALKDEYLQLPDTCDLEEISQTFKAKSSLPNCVGAMDGKHIRIQCPYNSGSQFYNYKNYHSIVLLATCNANCQFKFVDVGAYGSESDGGVFSRSEFGQKIESGAIKFPDPSPLPGTHDKFPFFFVADEAFPLKDYIMRPYPGNRLSEEQKIYNYRISSARRSIENAFGIFAQRFRIFRSEIILQPENAKLLVLACLCLHNFLIQTRGAQSDQNETSTSFVLSEHRRFGSNNASRNSQCLRDSLARYLVSPTGSVPWQRERALRGSF